MLWLEDSEKTRYMFKVEQGLPFYGIYQILSYIASVNRNT